MSKQKAKQKARRLLVQALYSWDLSGSNLSAIEAGFYAHDNMNGVDKDLFHDILHGIPMHLSEVDTAYGPHLDRNRDQLDPVSRAILRVATYELLYSMQVPYKVVINEGINLAKTFAPTDAYKFVNGVLDHVAAEQRSVEIATNLDAH
jgi:N utilization substance protein B